MDAAVFSDEFLLNNNTALPPICWPLRRKKLRFRAPQTCIYLLQKLLAVGNLSFSDAVAAPTHTLRCQATAGCCSTTPSWKETKHGTSCQVRRCNRRPPCLGLALHSPPPCRSIVRPDRTERSGQSAEGPLPGSGSVCKDWTDTPNKTNHRTCRSSISLRFYASKVRLVGCKT